VPSKQPVSIYDAKAQFSRICEEVAATGTEVIVSRHGKPLVRIIPFEPPRKFLFGVAKGQFTVPDDFDAPCPEIEKLFGVEP
jgi:prevent-host-death family protein